MVITPVSEFQVPLLQTHRPSDLWTFGLSGANPQKSEKTYVDSLVLLVVRVRWEQVPQCI